MGAEKDVHRHDWPICPKCLLEVTSELIESLSKDPPPEDSPEGRLLKALIAAKTSYEQSDT